MKTVEILIGQEVPADLSKFGVSWLTELTRTDGEVEAIRKPSYPSEINNKANFVINHNYDGMVGTLTYNAKDKTIKGSGYGWTSMLYCFD